MERSLRDEGFDVVAGLDEVGRGAWAGPVSVGVVVFPPGSRAPKGLCDSKLLTEEQREALFPGSSPGARMGGRSRRCRRV